VSFTITPTPVIVDASAAVELLDGDRAWYARFEHWLSEDRMLLAPSGLLPEVANASLVGQRASAAETLSRLDRTVNLGIEIADRGLTGVREAVRLADKHGLTVYDALYLQLALDVDGELVTLDADLRRAAVAEDLAVVG
jgi:predicted nucleic acid-binding protein